MFLSNGSTSPVSRIARVISLQLESRSGSLQRRIELIRRIGPDSQKSRSRAGEAPISSSGNMPR